VVNIIIGFVRGEYYYTKFIIFRKKKKGGSYIKNIIIKTKVINETPYGAKITEKVLLLNKYYYRGNFVRRKPSYYHRKNVINENKKNIITKKRYTKRTL